MLGLCMNERMRSRFQLENKQNTNNINNKQGWHNYNEDANYDHVLNSFETIQHVVAEE
jgi:hypothetical protein